MPPLELALEVTPRGRFDVIDVRAHAAQVLGPDLDAYRRRVYASRHTTAGFLPPSLGVRLTSRPGAIGHYLDVIRTMFPEGAGYLHDQLDLRRELLPEQREREPANADSHLAFIGSGLHACVACDTRRAGPVFFVDLDGTLAGVPRRRTTTLVGFDSEEEVARLTVPVPVSSHPIDAISLKESKLGLYEQVSELIGRHGVTKGRVRLELSSAEQYASLTINEYETLLMRHDLADVLRNPLRFAAQKALHAWHDPAAMPAKALAYAKYDLVRALNKLVETFGLQATRIERVAARMLEMPASRFLRTRRSVDLLVSDANSPGQGKVTEGTYQTPILIQWRSGPRDVRNVEVVLTRFL